MSTKIYTGIKFKTKSYKKVLDELLKLREKCVEIATEKIKKRDVISTYIKYSKVDKTDFSNLSAFDIRTHLFKDIEGDGYRDFWVPEINFSIVLYPSSNGTIYGVYFNDDDKYEKLLFETGIVEDYGYWDNTDQPEGMTYAQFEKRGKVWDKLLSGRFKDTGFTFNIVEADTLDHVDIHRYIHSELQSIIREIKLDSISS